MLGRIGSIEVDKQNVDSAKKGQQVAIRITPTSFTQNQFQVGRQFDENDELVSKLTRESIDLLKEFHQDSMTRSDWHLVIARKKQFEQFWLRYVGTGKLFNARAASQTRSGYAKEKKKGDPHLNTTRAQAWGNKWAKQFQAEGSGFSFVQVVGLGSLKYYAGPTKKKK